MSDFSIVSTLQILESHNSTKTRFCRFQNLNVSKRTRSNNHFWKSPTYNLFHGVHRWQNLWVGLPWGLLMGPMLVDPMGPIMGPTSGIHISESTCGVKCFRVAPNCKKVCWSDISWIFAEVGARKCTRIRYEKIKREEVRRESLWMWVLSPWKPANMVI